MKNYYAIIVGLIAFAALIVLTYSITFTSERPTCGDGVCIQTQVEEPIRANEPLTVWVNVTTERDIPNLEISLSASSGNVIPETSTPTSAPNHLQAQAFADEGRAHWLVDAEAGVPIIISGIIPSPPSDGVFEVIASVTTPNTTVDDWVRVDLTQPAQPGEQVNTPIPAAPYPGPSFIPPTLRPPTSIPMTAIAPTIMPRQSSTPGPGWTGVARTGTPRPASTTSPYPTGQIFSRTAIIKSTFILPTRITTPPPPTVPPPKPTVPPYP